MTPQTVIHLERYRIQARMEMFEQLLDWKAELYWNCVNHTSDRIEMSHFTTMNLANDLLQNKLTSMGTIRKNKACVPKEFLPNRSRLEFSSLFGFQNNCTLVSYVSKKRKAVILLYTIHHAPIHQWQNYETGNNIGLQYDQRWSGHLRSNDSRVFIQTKDKSIATNIFL